MAGSSRKRWPRVVEEAAARVARKGDGGSKVMDGDIS